MSTKFWYHKEIWLVVIFSHLFIQLRWFETVFLKRITKCTGNRFVVFVRSRDFKVGQRMQKHMYQPINVKLEKVVVSMKRTIFQKMLEIGNKWNGWRFWLSEKLVRFTVYSFLQAGSILFVVWSRDWYLDCEWKERKAEIIIFNLIPSIKHIYNGFFSNTFAFLINWMRKF